MVVELVVPSALIRWPLSEGAELSTALLLLVGIKDSANKRLSFDALSAAKDGTHRLMQNAQERISDQNLFILFILFPFSVI